MLVKGKAGIEAEVLLKSAGVYSNIVTLRVRFPRFVAEQFLKHRMFSCNAVSSRAMSVPKMNKWILDNTADPIFWGAQKKGMQPDQEHSVLLQDVEGYGQYIGLEDTTPEEAWYDARNFAMCMAKAYWDAGYHQQIPNRLTHAFQMAEYIVTATDFDNFFNLRLHDKAAQSEITELARCMKEAIDKTLSKNLHKGWHIPYVVEEELDNLSIYNHLINDTNLHLTPMEHQALSLTRMERLKIKTLEKFAKELNMPTRVRYFANLNGWKSQRYLLENNLL